MTTKDLSDGRWVGLRLLLPPQKPGTGRPAKDYRTVLDGILWIVCTGSPWRFLPDRYGCWKTVSSRFYRWQQSGVWEHILSMSQQRADAEGRLDWSLHSVDRTLVRAHQHAAGAKGGIQLPRFWVGAAAGIARRSIFAASAAASRWCWHVQGASGMSSRCCRS